MLAALDPATEQPEWAAKVVAPGWYFQVNDDGSGAVDGFAFGSIDARGVGVVELWLSAAQRGTGLGRELLIAVVAHLVEVGVHGIAAHVAAENLRANGFCLKNGARAVDCVQIWLQPGHAVLGIEWVWPNPAGNLLAP